FGEAFRLATVGGGAFFGRVGSFSPGFEFDAVVLDDRRLRTPHPRSPAERLERLFALTDGHELHAKYVAGKRLLLDE
ncbi:MAG: guanine deaminase, partial [Oscillospiraceae bacterium]